MKETCSYVFHPINAFHLLHRIIKWIPKLSKVIPSLDFQFSLPSSQDANVGAANGIADLQEHYNTNPIDFIHGKVQDYETGSIYYSNSNLTSQETLVIATAAKMAGYLDSYVSWCKAALQVSKLEKRDPKYLSNIKKLIQKAKSAHDEAYNIFNFTKKLDTFVRLNEKPFLSSVATEIQETEFNLRYQDIQSRYENVIYKSTPYLELQNDLGHRLDFYLRRRSQSLCRGDFVRHPMLELNLHCLWLHHDDPYLKLAPFKLEYQHRHPEVTIIHDFASPEELAKVRNLAKGHMKSTPYLTGKHCSKMRLFLIIFKHSLFFIGGTETKEEESYSKLRTSKVMYMNELLVPEAMRLSKKVQQVTRFKLKDDKYGSENFQVMNYGIGGRISTHLDSVGGRTKDTSEAEEVGGFRVTTFMVYMTDVQAGGRTIFPQAGISVKPEEGKALFWYNVGTRSNFDSRIFHLGCPVMYGNKWIANKWIKLLPQFQNFPSWRRYLYYTTVDPYKRNKVSPF